MGAYLHSKFKIELSKILSLFISWTFPVCRLFFTVVHTPVRANLGSELVVPFWVNFWVTLTYIILITFCYLCCAFYFILADPLRIFLCVILIVLTRYIGIL